MPSVLIDNYEASRKAVNYLCKFGHKRIGYVSMDYDGRNTVKERFLGYKKGLSDNNIKYDTGIVLIDKELMFDEMNRSYNLCKDFFSMRNMPTAVMAATDNIAAGVYVALKKNNNSIPSDVSVIGFDDLQISKYFDPSLTTVKQPKEDMGVFAMRLLIDVINKKDIENNHIIFGTEIIKRNSVTNVRDKLVN